MCQAELSAHVSVPTSVPRVLDMKNVMLKSKNKDGGQIFKTFGTERLTINYTRLGIGINHELQ